MIRHGAGAKITLGIPAIDDIEFVSAKVRDSDCKDMEGLHPDKNIKDIIMHDVLHSKVVYGLYRGGIIYGLLGVIPLEATGVGTPWVVGSSEVDNCPFPFARASKSILDMLQKCFPVLDTWICAQNSKSMRWHRWCGFEFDKEKVRIGRDEYYHAVRLAETNIRKENR